MSLAIFVFQTLSGTFRHLNRRPTPCHLQTESHSPAKEMTVSIYTPMHVIIYEPCNLYNLLNQDNTFWLKSAAEAFIVRPQDTRTSRSPVSDLSAIKPSYHCPSCSFSYLWGICPPQWSCNIHFGVKLFHDIAKPLSMREMCIEGPDSVCSWLSDLTDNDSIYKTALLNWHKLKMRECGMWRALPSRAESLVRHSPGDLIHSLVWQPAY